MNVNPNPWIIEQRIAWCKDRAEQNGFRLDHGDGNNTINIVADKPPYGKDVVIARIYDWSLVEMFFLGYEQGKLETNIVATLAKRKKNTHDTKPEWQGLTDDEIHDCFQNRGRGSDGLKTRKLIAAAIEAMLKEKNT